MQRNSIKSSIRNQKISFIKTADTSNGEFLYFINIVHCLPKELKYADNPGFQRAADGGT